MQARMRARPRSAVPPRQSARAAVRPSGLDADEQRLQAMGNQAAVDVLKQQEGATLAAPGSGIRTAGMKGSQAAELGWQGLRPDEAFLGGVGAEKLGEPVGAGAELTPGLQGGGKGAMEGLQDLLGLAAGAEGLIPGRGPDLSAGPAGILAGLGRKSVTGGLFDPFAGQGKTPLGEGAGVGPDPQVSSAAQDVFQGTIESWGTYQRLGGDLAQGGDLVTIGDQAMDAMPDKGSPLANALGRVEISQKTGAEPNPGDEKMVQDAADRAGGTTPPTDAEKAAGFGGSTGGEQDSGSTGDDTQKTDQSTPDPEKGDGKIGGSPKRQAEFKAWMALATRKQDPRATKTQEWAMGDTRETGSAKALAAMVAAQEAAAPGNRLAPWILTDEEDAGPSLGGDEVVPEVENWAVDPVRGSETPAKTGPKPKP